MNTMQLLSGHISKAHSNDAGFDIYPTQSKILYPNSSNSIETDLRITLPLNHFALVKPRSGLSFKNDCETGAGVIDNGYEGEIKVKFYNKSDHPVTISPEKAIAQLIVFYQPPITVEVIGGKYDAPQEKQRSTNGFGSSDGTQLDSSSFNLNQEDLLDYVPEQAG